MDANWEGESLNKWLELKQGLEEELKLVKKIYVIKRRLANPKSVRFGNTQFTVRYKRIGKICVKIKPPTEDKKRILEFCRKVLKYE